MASNGPLPRSVTPPPPPAPQDRAQVCVPRADNHLLNYHALHGCKRRHRARLALVTRSGSPVFDSYARLSWNPSMRGLEKIETQHGDNEATIARHGGTVGRYLDDGLSAWKAGVRRKDVETLLERARAGLTQGIVVWHVDRLFRQPRDLERLIDLADHGFRVISSHGWRDLSDPDDRHILRIEVAHTARSSDDTSRRIKRRHQRFPRGRPAGGWTTRVRVRAPRPTPGRRPTGADRGHAARHRTASGQWCRPSRSPRNV